MPWVRGRSHVRGLIDKGDYGFATIVDVEIEPARVSHWLRRDLPHRAEALGLPVTVVTAKQSERTLSDAG